MSLLLDIENKFSQDTQILLTYALFTIQQENLKLYKEVSQLKDEITKLKEQLELAKHQRFGKKSEVGEPLSQDTSKLIHINAHVRKKKTNGRLIDLSLLPRHKIHHDLSDKDKSCSCCQNQLKFIGSDISEKLEVLPQRLYVEEHIRYKYSCTHCEIIIMAPKEASPIPKALAGGSLLAEVIISKYQYHLPLYRQSKILASYNAVIPDNTLGNWVMQTGDKLLPIYDALWEAILSSKYLQIDETPIKILNPEKNGYLWCYYAPHIGSGLIVFDLSLSRSGSNAETRLFQYEGLIQTDGYSGYSKLRNSENIDCLGCLTHARRKFDEVLKISKNKEGIAAQAIEKLKPLYALEAMMREKNYNFKTKKYFRKKIARPILLDFKSWLIEIRSSVPPKSKLGEAIQYTLNQWKFISKYLRHGMVEIDTNLVENKIREIACGRKNWMFMGNKDSGNIHALFYSLVLSSIANKLNPRLYIHYLISKIHNIRKNEVAPKNLLPHTVDIKLLEEFANYQIHKAKNLLNTI